MDTKTFIILNTINILDILWVVFKGSSVLTVIIPLCVITYVLITESKIILNKT